MIVKLTHAVDTESGRLEAGQIVEIDADTAALWIATDWAFEFVDEVIPVTSHSDPQPVYIDAPKKKVKHG